MKSKHKTSPANTTAEFERVLKESSATARYVLRLYVTGATPRSAQAVANIHSLCEEYLLGRYDLEVIDIYQQPEEAFGDQIIAAPTLIKSLPMPARRLIGDLSDRNKMIIGLNLSGEKTQPDAEANTKWMEL